MDGPSPSVPDGITPLIGYRLWRVIEERGEIVLSPLNFESRDWVGATSGWVSSTCGGSELWVSPEGELEWPDRHRAPGEECACGFYAMKQLTPEMLLGASSRHAHRVGSRSDERFVLGRVQLAGKIVEHELGYRAERARIAELIPIRGSEPEIQAIATRLGVGVARAVIVPGAPDFRERLEQAWAATKPPPLSRADGILPVLFLVVGALAWLVAIVTASTQDLSAGLRVVSFVCLVLHAAVRSRTDPSRVPK
ncbi:MAG TPA: hypothetical protein VFI35_07075 [Actinomycetota bacterium]|nr:hypothetical protein [Actinomycetota bacterium]